MFNGLMLRAVLVGALVTGCAPERRRIPEEDISGNEQVVPGEGEGENASDEKPDDCGTGSLLDDDDFNIDRF